MSLMIEYIGKLQKEGVPGLESELLTLIARYNQIRDKYLFIYVAAIGKPIPMLGLDQSDYYIFHDMLAKNKGVVNDIDIYLETPGGSGEAAEEIVKFLHDNFRPVSFIVSGEAKSAGTLMVLSGDEILMTETGSLGPIDAQIHIGRSTISAYDYIEWVDEKRKEAESQGRLNPFDAVMVAQITPGELGSVLHSLKFAEDLVTQWLVKYKFKNWTQTETQKIPVTEDMKADTAKKISDQLINHSKWRSHGRSIKMNDLEEIGLKIKHVQDNPKLADIVYRIQAVCRMIFESSLTYKIFATQDEKIFKQAAMATMPMQIPQKAAANVVQIQQQCPKCNKVHSLYGKFEENPIVDQELKKKGFIPFPKDAKLKCDCGFEIDLLGIKNQIEIQAGKKIID